MFNIAKAKMGEVKQGIKRKSTSSGHGGGSAKPAASSSATRSSKNRSVRNEDTAAKPSGGLKRAASSSHPSASPAKMPKNGTTSRPRRVANLLPATVQYILVCLSGILPEREPSAAVREQVNQWVCWQLEQCGITPPSVLNLQTVIDALTSSHGRLSREVQEYIQGITTLNSKLSVAKRGLESSEKRVQNYKDTVHRRDEELKELKKVHSEAVAALKERHSEEMATLQTRSDDEISNLRLALKKSEDARKCDRARLLEEHEAFKAQQDAYMTSFGQLLREEAL